MRILSLFIVLNFFYSFFCFGDEPASQSFRPELAVWRIYDSNERIQGTGFIVEKKYFVTATHVMEAIFEGSLSRETDPFLKLLLSVKGESIEDKDITLSQEGSSSVLRIKKVVGLSYASDLVVLEIEGETEHSLKLRGSPIRYGEPVFIIGYPHNKLTRVRSSLFIENVLYYQFQIRRGVYTKEDVRGASGAPILDKDGQVVGVLSRSTDNYGSVISSMVEDISVVKVSYLKQLIKNIRRRLHPLPAGLIVRDYIKEKRRQLYDLVERNNPLYQYILAKQYNDEKEYLYWMRRAAGNNLPDAQYELAMYYGTIYRTGKRDKRNLNRSFYWMRRAAGSGHLVLAQYELSLMYSEEGDKQNFERSFYWMKQAAENKRNYPRARYLLAAKYDEGEGTEPNPKRSFYWMKKAAEQGLSEAQYELAVKYEKGDGVRKNLERSFYWMKKAAEQGLPEAQYELAVKYEKGKGTELNAERSFYWMKRAAEKGSQDAQYVLSSKYSKGENTEQNLELALEWFEKAENKKYGFYEGQLRHVNREFDNKNFREGLNLLFRFARMENFLVYYKLAHMYSKGEHVEKNFERSFHLMKEAAEKGYVPAFYKLAIKYEQGEGTEKNPELAQRYFELAAKGGHPLAQRRCSGAFGG